MATTTCPDPRPVRPADKPGCRHRSSIFYLSEGRYEDLDDVHHRFPEVRIFLSLPLS
jgi:hypothetical protein